MTVRPAPAVSILIPCFKAGATVRAAVESALAQSVDHLEVILSSDDGRDYLAHLGIADQRLRQVSTGATGAGDGSARTAALEAARGRFIANLDADDTIRPERIARMLPVAEDHGACIDNTAMWIDGRIAKTAFEPGDGHFGITADVILAPRVPMNALVRRDLAGGGWHAFRFCSDVIFNLEVLSRCPAFRALRWTGYDYVKRDGSITQSPETPHLAAEGYRAIIAAIDAGRLDLTPAIAETARAEFAANEAANRKFRNALAKGRVNTLEEFLAR